MLEDSKYNEEPVYYCADCLSLKIVEEQGVTFCAECGSGQCNCDYIDVWRKKYREMYGFDYLDKRKRKFNKRRKYGRERR